MAEQPVVVGGAGRPYPGETVSGDGWSVDWHHGRCRISVVDGLGHDAAAAAVAQLALDTLSASPDLRPAEALRLCHDRLRGSRGAAIAIVEVDVVVACLTFVGVGNVEALLWQAGRRERPIAYRGIVGGTLPRIRAFEFPLEQDWLLVMHTDGVRARFDLDQISEEIRRRPRALAEALLEQYGRHSDDATVVVAASGRPSAPATPAG